jgi:radical SAM protein with 4Fe4S-binding SPASM domain
MPTFPSDAVNQSYRDVLHRSPDPLEFVRDTRQLRTGRLNREALDEELRQSAEYREVVQPLCQDVEHVYERFLFRPPTAAERTRHIQSFFQRYPAKEDRIAAVRGGRYRRHLDIRPFNVEIDVTTQCNLRCIMCYFSDARFSRRKREDISVDEFTRVAEQVFPLCQFVALSSSVEPFLHPEFGRFVGITKDLGVPHVDVTTNAILMTDALIEQLLDAGLDSMNISIDAATKSTYERLRRGGRFDRLIANVQALVAAKRRRATAKPWITFNMVLMRSNICELPALVQLARELGVPGVGGAHLTPYAGLHLEGESLESDTELCNEMLNQAKACGQANGIAVCLPAAFSPPAPQDALLQVDVSRLEHDFTKPKVVESAPRREVSAFGLNVPADAPDHCMFPWHYAIIGPYGEVQPCGWWYDEPMGNIREESFEAIWNGERFRALRESHTRRRLGPNCFDCPAAGMGNVNNRDSFAVKVLG